MKILLAILAVFGLAAGCVIPLDRPSDPKDSSRPVDPSNLKDPVCGVTCYGDKCERETFQNKEYCFCSKECQKKFDENPQKYQEKP